MKRQLSAVAATGAVAPETRPAMRYQVEPALLDDPQAADFYNVGLRTFDEYQKEAAELRRAGQDHWLPVPIQLGPRTRRWSRAELEAAITRMPRQQAPAAEPLQLHLAKKRAASATNTEVRGRGE